MLRWQNNLVIFTHRKMNIPTPVQTCRAYVLHTLLYIYIYIYMYLKESNYRKAGVKLEELEKERGWC